MSEPDNACIDADVSQFEKEAAILSESLNTLPGRIDTLTGDLISGNGTLSAERKALLEYSIASLHEELQEGETYLGRLYARLDLMKQIQTVAKGYVH